MTTRRSPGWAWLATVSVMAVLIASGITVWYVQRTVGRMCGLIQLLATSNPPPTTDRGRLTQERARQLAHDYRCKIEPSTITITPSTGAST